MKLKKAVILAMLLSLILIFAMDSPVAEIKPYSFELHGIKLEDNYHWMKDKSRTEEEVLKYLEAENKFTDDYMGHTQGLQDTLFKEFKSRIREEDSSVPYKLKNYWYYSRDEKGYQYPKYCRKYASLDNNEDVYLDVNELAEGREYLQIGSLKISPDENMLAYLADYSGAEEYKLYIKDLKSGELLADSLDNVDDICWANDNQTVFYCTLDESGRTDKVWRHVLGGDFEDDELIYYEEDPAFYAYVYRSKSRKYIVIGTGSKTSSEMRIIPADQPDKDPVLVEERRPDIQYYLTHHEDEFFISTNEDAPDYKLMRTSEDALGRENWQEFIPHRKGVSFGHAIFKDHIILFETENYSDRIRVIGLNDDTDYEILPPDHTAKLYSSYMPEYNSTKFRYYVESMQSPWKIYEYDAVSKEQVMLKKQYLGEFSEEDYHSERLYATADDGTQIPISLVYNKKEFSRDGEHPLFITGYGAYGDNSDPYLSKTRLSMMDRGFCWAIAHVRGGGEMGRKWYDQGRMFNKKNTFTDFIAVTEHLIAENYSQPDKIVIEGASAGGLLVGAVMNMRPDLFGVVIGDVPFVDMMNTMLDPSLSATVSEYEEWGNPQIKEQFEYMYSYCPYYNVKAQDYPNILLTGGFYDPRVNYWEPAKLCAKLRQMKTDDNVLLLKITEAGHGGSSGRFDYLKEIAFEYAFIIDRIVLNN